MASLRGTYAKCFPEFVNPLNSLVKHGLCDIGLYGELIARIILLCCQFSSIDPSFDFPRKSIFVPLETRNFFDKIIW